LNIDTKLSDSPLSKDEKRTEIILDNNKFGFDSVDLEIIPDYNS